MEGPNAVMSLRDMLAVVLQELSAGLDEAGMLDSMCALTVFPGNAVPVDYIGSDGSCGAMGWVRHVSSAPTVRFPAADVSIDNCTYTLAHLLEVGIIRPSPIPESDGQTVELPDDLAHLGAALELADDMILMKNAIARAAKSIDFVILGSYTPIGPEGGAVGGSWSLTVGDDDDA
jgi:hypothetical protein